MYQMLIKYYKEINKYPHIEKDVAFIIDDEIESSTLVKDIKKIGGKLLTDITIFDVYKKEMKDNKKSVAYKLKFESFERTLTEEEVMILFNKIITGITTKYHAELRDK